MEWIGTDDQDMLDDKSTMLNFIVSSTLSDLAGASLISQVFRLYMV